MTNQRVYVDRVLKNTYQHLSKQVDNSIDYYSDDTRFAQDEYSALALWHLKWVKKAIAAFTVDIDEWGDRPIIDDEYYSREDNLDGKGI